MACGSEAQCDQGLVASRGLREPGECSWSRTSRLGQETERAGYPRPVSSPSMEAELQGQQGPAGDQGLKTQVRGAQ